MPGPALEVSDLVTRYGPVTALDRLSLTADRNRITAVLGPNGAGKTTAVETCAGFRRQDSGSVRVLGLDPAADAGPLRQVVGLMLQSGGVPPGARPVEMLRLAGSLYAHPLDADLLVDALDLGGVLRTPYRRMSGGEQRRLAFALAVVGRPELVFLDEPTAGLDPHARRSVHAMIRRLRADGVTVLLTTHALDEAEQLADHVVIVHRGRVVAGGTPVELTAGGPPDELRFRGPAEVDTSALTAALPEGWDVVASAGGVYQVRGGGGEVDPQVLATVTAWCAQQGFMPAGLDVGRRSLEDVFLEVTGRQAPS